MASTPEWAYFATYGPTLAYQCTLWPHIRAGDYYVVDLSVYIGLTLLLSTAELGTKFAVELRSGPATEIGGCLTAELGAALWQSHRMF
jgi:hypothetical protein